jgi:hypothetical protein
VSWFHTCHSLICFSEDAVPMFFVVGIFFSLRAHIKNEENIQDGCVPCLLVLVTDA